MEQEENSDNDEDATTPKGRDFDLNQIRSELKGFNKTVKVNVTDAFQKDAEASDDSSGLQDDEKAKDDLEGEFKVEETTEKVVNSDDIYEFKEPEPFEFETRKSGEEKNKKRLVPRVIDELDKSPKRKILRSPKTEPMKEPMENKKIFKKNISKRLDECNDDDDSEEGSKDPFDKLVKSPSFNSGKIAEKNLENKPAKSLVEQPNLFKVSSESMEDDCDEQMNISDNEDTNEDSKEVNPSSTSLPIETSNPGPSDIKTDKDINDDNIMESIQRAIDQTSTDDDSSDGLSIQNLKTTLTKEEIKPTLNIEKPIKTDFETKELKGDVEVAKNININVQTKISPVFQESDSSLYEAIYSTPQVVTKIDEFKDLNVKTGTKIADSLLQKFCAVKNDTEIKSPKEEKGKSPEPQVQIEETEKIEVSLEAKEEFKDTDDEDDEDMNLSDLSKNPDIKTKLNEIKTDSSTSSFSEHKIKENEIQDVKKRARKVLSREFIEDSDSDSSDSEQRLIIARSDDDSQTSVSLENKPDVKETDSINSVFKSITDDSQTQPEINFTFKELINKSPPEFQESSNVNKENVEVTKDEEADSHLHSLLLCEETIPGSPAPPITNEENPKGKNVLEMPFASAPSSSNTKGINDRKVVKDGSQTSDLMQNIEGRDDERTGAIDNSPPTTPESTLSNLSPRG